MSEGFTALPRSVQRKIDRVFWKYASTIGASSAIQNKEKAATHSEGVSGGGGFIIEEDSNVGSGGGGFIVEEDTVDVEQPQDESEAPGAKIAFASIPSALQLLDLPSNDEEILEVFRNATAGWEGAEHASDDEGGAVTLDDWRAVCAVLLDNGGDAGASMDIEMGDGNDDGEYDDGEGDIDGGKEESEDEEYVQAEETPARRRKSTRNSNTPRKRGRRARSSSEDSEIDDDRPLTARQKNICLEAFSLMFPSDPPIDTKDLPGKKIMIADLQRCAKLVGEKFKMEEIVEMLEFFSSSSQDKRSMSLEDFERMMKATKLVR